MTCDCCKKEQPDEAIMYDVAVMATVASVVNLDKNEWDPQLEGYICSTCWYTIPLNVRKALA